MGMKKNESQGSSTHNSNTTKHFSHQHLLKLIQQSPNSLLPSSCAGCHWPSDQDTSIYICTVCSFYLHKTCFDMPTSLTHRSHKAHPFTLFAKPVYPNGIMVCDACGGQGTSFSYHCRPCGKDLHLRCAIIPLSAVHSYHEHKLELAFESPYGETDYTCGICKMRGNKQWLYRCNSCRLDVHVKCAYEHDIPSNSNQPPPQQQNLASFVNNLNQPPSQQQNLTSFMTNFNQPPSQQQFHQNILNYQLPAYLQNLTSYHTNNRDLNQNKKSSTGGGEVEGGGLRLESRNDEYERVETERKKEVTAKNAMLEALANAGDYVGSSSSSSTKTYHY